MNPMTLAEARERAAYLRDRGPVQELDRQAIDVLLAAVPDPTGARADDGFGTPFPPPPPPPPPAAPPPPEE